MAFEIGRNNEDWAKTCRHCGKEIDPMCAHFLHNYLKVATHLECAIKTAVDPKVRDGTIKILTER